MAFIYIDVKTIDIKSLIFPSERIKAINDLRDSKESLENKLRSAKKELEKMDFLEEKDSIKQKIILLKEEYNKIKKRQNKLNTKLSNLVQDKKDLIRENKNLRKTIEKSQENNSTYMDLGMVKIVDSKIPNTPAGKVIELRLENNEKECISGSIDLLPINGNNKPFNKTILRFELFRKEKDWFQSGPIPQSTEDFSIATYLSSEC